MSKALFLSTYINRVDKKGRVSVPAPFRAELGGQGFYAIVSPKEKALECFSRAQMEELSDRLDQFDLFSDTQDDLAAAILGSAVPLAFDSEGRVVLPSVLAQHAGITTEAAFFGRGRTFQIWEPAALEARQAEARARVKAQGLTVPAIPKKTG